jgi:hypothetical protein
MQAQFGPVSVDILVPIGSISFLTAGSNTDHGTLLTATASLESVARLEAFHRVR